MIVALVFVVAAEIEGVVGLRWTWCTLVVTHSVSSRRRALFRDSSDRSL